MRSLVQRTGTAIFLLNNCHSAWQLCTVHQRFVFGGRVLLSSGWYSITLSRWREKFSHCLFFCKMIGHKGRAECPAPYPDLTNLDFYFWGILKATMYAKKFQEYCKTWDTELKLPVPPFHCRLCLKYATHLHFVVSNALTLMVDIFNVLGIKESNIIID